MPTKPLTNFFSVHACVASLLSTKVNMLEIQNTLTKQQFYMIDGIARYFCDSLFISICKLQHDLMFLLWEKQIAQTFYNDYLIDDKWAITCLNIYLVDMISNKDQFFIGWEYYIIKLSSLYEQGNIEGGHFTIQ